MLHCMYIVQAFEFWTWVWVYGWICMLHCMRKDLIFGQGFGVTDRYVVMILSMHKNFSFGGVLGVTNINVYMLLSIYMHLIFGGGELGIQSLRNHI